LLLPPGGDDPDQERTYFDPERWDAEYFQKGSLDDRDPVAQGRGRQNGTGTAALLLSDFHMADGSAGGDDFLESHLQSDPDIGLHTGFEPAGRTRAPLLASVVTFALARVRQQAGAEARLDVVLHGDVVNFIELKGRCGTLVARKHAPFYRTLVALQGKADVYWLRGNHDYVVPTGPWKSGEF
jgi:hypothetical protein